ncbi:DUF916 and DUF3324 domain-containing protein [Vagococcus sp. BWB3-3]|uniref:DUF916 and DUF3324 domain-containing protein n=1 Tax=Vagococcus allomyrinae TaxID=2794353 RepID=A0A940PF95_9ENTE|nr:DUF916 and DUF3324 domain-containing protein [Vagococcus allomyrinae]MBP1042456.1 DUF916 and DUF3324 domain-containing protein [Vagococcus allomyrinae]
MLKRVIVTLSFIVSFFLMGLKVNAANLDFSVTPETPETQVDKSKTYFDIKVTPKVNQELIIEVENLTKKPLVLEPSISRASTNIDGIVEYAKLASYDYSADQTLSNDIEKMVTLNEKEIKLKGLEKKKIKLLITGPDQGFDGVLAGSIRIKKKSESDQGIMPKNEGLKNDYAYLIALVLHGSDAELTSKLSLKGVRPEIIDKQKMLIATLVNEQPMFINKVAVGVEVFSKETGQLMYKSEIENGQMAPNSYFDYPIYIDDNLFEAGSYQVEMLVASDQGKWEFKKDFTLTKEKAAFYNERYKELTKEASKFNVIIVVVVTIIGAMLIYFMISLLRSQKKLTKSGEGKRKKRRR